MNDRDYDMIIRYLDGEMSEDEQSAFARQLEQDKDLQQEVDLLREVNETLKMKLHPDENELALRESMEEMRGEYFKSGAKLVRFPDFKRWMVAAAVLLIAVLSVFILKPGKKDLYKQYAYIEMPPVAQRGTPADSLLHQAREDFNHKKFTASISAFEAILKADPQNSFAGFYYAIALLETGQTDQSRKQLGGLYEGNSVFKYNAAFYMALSYLKEKDVNSCKEWLNKIPGDAGIYPKAKKLLQQL